jgi:hypothetical protein
MIAPVGDIQYGSTACDTDKLERHLEFGKQHDWHFVGMGDYLDHFSPSNRSALVRARGDLYDSARELLDGAIYDRLHGLAQIMEPSRNRWLGMVAGDHTWDFEDGQNADEVLAGMLNAPFSDGAMMIHVKYAGCPLPLRIFALHGAGASVSITGKTLHLERLMRSWDADIYLMGHSHLKYGVPVDKHETIVKRGKSYLVRRTKVIGITGSFMDGYSLGKKTYVEEKALSPIPTGGILIEAHPVEEEYGWRWDMFVSA